MSKFREIKDTDFRYSFKNEHVALRAVRLITDTDHVDAVLEETERLCYRATTERLYGHIFIATERTERRAVVLIAPAPDFVMPSAKIDDSVLTADAVGYPLYVAECDAADSERLVRDWYREYYKPNSLCAMSNTWGDRNGRTRVCDEFIRREIESGADLGLDVVQIDDGWQTGVPTVYDSDGVRMFEGDFWKLKSDIFPNGMRSLSDYARERGVELGLWFAPHSRGAFEHFERDFEVLLEAYRDWGIRYFKLDMISLPTRQHCDKMLELISKTVSLGEGVSVELDVTTDQRLGYLLPARYGTIFVENRYTAWASYYPHRTLRNLWMISRFIPSAKLQFEIVNPDLYTDKYNADDPFRHGLYSADYLFVSVMLSNPLFWMETQFLSERARADLKAVIPLWKQYRESFAHADVRPTGETPTGASLTGFIADTGDSLHVILLREATERDAITVDLGITPASIELIAEKTETSHAVHGTTLTVAFSSQRSYVWLRLAKS